MHLKWLACPWELVLVSLVTSNHTLQPTIPTPLQLINCSIHMKACSISWDLDQLVSFNDDMHAGPQRCVIAWCTLSNLLQGVHWTLYQCIAWHARHLACEGTLPWFAGCLDMGRQKGRSFIVIQGLRDGFRGHAGRVGLDAIIIYGCRHIWNCKAGLRSHW